MSFITAHNGLGFIGSGDLLKVFKIGKSTEMKTAFSWTQINADLIKKPDFEEEKALKNVEKIQILCLAHSNVSSPNNRRLLAVGTNEKQIHVIEYHVDEQGEFLKSEHVVTAIVPKAPTALVFDREDAHIIVGDRAGDVHRFSVTEGKTQELAGAISMILDVGFTPSGKQLLMTDRDEKLRVMRYPETYVIDAYCLGHTEYVRTMAVRNEQTVFTAGGDMKILEWNITETPAKPRVTKDLSEYGKKGIRRIAHNSNYERLAVILEDSDRLITVDTDPVPFHKREIKNLQVGQLLDVAVDGDNFLVLGRSSLAILSADNLKFEYVSIDEELKKSLQETPDAVNNLYKNVTHNNQAEYEKRKAEKFEKIDCKKKKLDSNVAEN